MPPTLIQGNAAQTPSDATQGGGDMIGGLLDNPYVAMIAKIIFAIVVVIVFIMIAKIVAAIVKNKIIAYADHQENKEFGNQIAHLMEDVVFYSFVIIAFFIGFKIIGFDVGLILGGISFGVGLAFKEVLGNMIAGIFLLTMKEIKLGDFIYIHADQEYFGKIEEINIRTTTLRTLDLKQIILPNIKLIDSPMKTYSSEEMIRLTAPIEVHYDSDLAYVCKVFEAAVNSCPFVVNPKMTKILVSEFRASGILITSYFRVNPDCEWPEEQLVGYVNHVLMTYARANNIKIPYPHVSLQMEGKIKQVFERFATANT